MLAQDRGGVALRQPFRLGRLRHGLFLRPPHLTPARHVSQTGKRRAEPSGSNSRNRYNPTPAGADLTDRPLSPRGGARMNTSTANADGKRRSGSTAAAFLIGIPLAAAVLGFVLYGPGRETNEAHKIAYRYLSHPVECVEVLLFCCALGTLAVKLWSALGERRACRAGLLPAWDGKPAPADQAPELLAGLNRRPRRLQETWLGWRVRNVVEFVCQRRSAADLDDHLRTLADNDALALEGSYSLTRFITWAMPILGFLGTVLGITGAIAGITPEVLEKNLNAVTDGLALAFDATALALACTMVTMFCTFLVERLEQGV